MKVPKELALLLPIIVLSACIGAKSMEVTYTVRSGMALKNYTVYLLVNDRRSIDSLVGASAQEKGLFEELRNGRFNLKVSMPNGQMVSITGLSATEAVREAAGRRLQSLGVTTTSQRSAAHLTVEINIDQMEIDLHGSDLVATVGLSSQIYRDQNAIAKSNTTAISNRMRLIGGAGGATVLSEALSQAMNDLDLSGVNKF